MPDKLQDIRAEIDRLDKEIHDRIQRRARLVEDLIPVKKQQKSQIIQPVREIQLLRYLVDQHEGNIPARSLIAIWREITSAMSHIQDSSLKVAVSYPAACSSTALWDHARDTFGNAIPAVRFEAPTSVLAAVRRDDAAFGVLPWPVDGEDKPWWIHLIKHQDNISIVSTVPCFDFEDEPLHEEVKGLVVAKLDFMPSGNDHSFIALNSEGGISKTKLTKHLEEHDLTPLRIISYNEGGEGETVYLIELDTYFDHDDKRFEALSEVFLKSDSDYFLVLGGYPVMPVIKN